jgi:hypothetical protein
MHLLHECFRASFITLIIVFFAPDLYSNTSTVHTIFRETEQNKSFGLSVFRKVVYTDVLNYSWRWTIPWRYKQFFKSLRKWKKAFRFIPILSILRMSIFRYLCFVNFAEDKLLSLLQIRPWTSVWMSNMCRIAFFFFFLSCLPKENTLKWKWFRFF